MNVSAFGKCEDSGLPTAQRPKGARGTNKFMFVSNYIRAPHMDLVGQGLGCLRPISGRARPTRGWHRPRRCSPDLPWDLPRPKATSQEAILDVTGRQSTIAHQRGNHAMWTGMEHNCSLWRPLPLTPHRRPHYVPPYRSWLCRIASGLASQGNLERRCADWQCWITTTCLWPACGPRGTSCFVVFASGPTKHWSNPTVQGGHRNTNVVEHITQRGRCRLIFGRNGLDFGRT